MKKKVLTKSMKKDIMEIIKKYIKTKQPELDDEKLVKDFLTKSQKKTQEFIDNFEYPNEKEIIKLQENKFSLRSTFYITSYIDLVKFDCDEEKFNLINTIKTFYSYSMPEDFLYLFEDKKYTYEYQKIKELRDKNNSCYADLRTCYNLVYRDLYADDFILKYNELKKQYRDILSKFEAIVCGTKYAVDLLEIINIPEVKTYIENQLKTNCTAISCVSQETIDFVKEYLNNDK